ncbi:MAG: ABC-F family ATP-binding cassette domain-containing protein [Microthrixaceae bacterium]|nr:ABC-F family ATP-binding cassette domain-containing protein [Microthrixaceae bacterium]
MILVDAAGVTMTRPGRSLFTDLSLTLSTGDRLGVVGVNGSGKSTLLRVLAGRVEPESGVVRRGSGAVVSMLDQGDDLGAGTVRSVVGGDWRAEAVLDRLGLTPVLDRDVASVSGGQRKRAALARALSTECDLLVLDEPTNHLDIEAIAWLEEWLAAFTGGLALVTHDRHVLDRVTNRVLEIDRTGSYVHEGGYASYLEGRAERAARAEAAEAVRANLAKRELIWLRHGAPARTRKSKYRVARAEELQQVARTDDVRAEDLDLHQGTPRLGKHVIEMTDVSFAHPGRPPLLEGVDLLLGPGDRMGVVGANGAGKSTLLGLVAGELAPTSGEVRIGPTVQLAHYDQTGRHLDPGLRVHEVVCGVGVKPDWRDVRLMERFWFDADAQRAPVELLSGGERRRLQLVALLMTRPNVLLLDEPTNDLDLDTLRVLEEFLDDWPGTLVVASHDRAFLGHTVEDVVILDGSGTAARRPGGYAAWADERLAARRRGRGGGAEGSEPGAGARAGRRRSVPAGPKPRSRSTLTRLLREADKEVQKLARRRERLHEQLLEAAADHQELARLGTEEAAVAARLEAAEEAWLALAEEAEALDA